MGAARRRNIREMRNREIVTRGKLDLRNDRRVRRGREEGSVARTDTAARIVLRLLAMVAAMMRRLRRLRGCSHAELCRAGMNSLQRNAPEPG